MMTLRADNSYCFGVLSAPPPMTPRLLIITQSQFGYQTDAYYWAKYLKKHFRIDYVCWDYSRPRIRLDGIRVFYISRQGSLVYRNYRFLSYVLKTIRKNRYDIHIIKYFRGCSLLNPFSRSRCFLLDIRTGSTSPKKIRRFFYDTAMRLEACFFNHISVISKGLKNRLKLPDRSYILPLGAESFALGKGPIVSINLLYVGILSYRRMDLTIEGFAKFYNEYKDQVEISYTIVGGGYHNEEGILKKLCEAKGISEAVRVMGPVPHQKLRTFFESHNIGVAFIPKTRFFDVQPPTKTFEYLLSGMPVIATDTTENARVITSRNGVLINDTSNAFYNGLKQIYLNRNDYDRAEIKKNAGQYTWDRITDNFKRHLDRLMDQ